MFLGIDTSCYTTSVAVCDKKGRLVSDERIILPVPQGEQGLKQSTALFYHLKNLPELMERTAKAMEEKSINAIAVSMQPRPVEESYMPVFISGGTVAKSMASMLNVPLVETSHQEGHIVAGLWSAGILDSEELLVVHLSGGTSELLKVRKINNKPLKFKINILGSTMDIHAGQLVDRVGVYMGYSFPAGPQMEKEGKKCTTSSCVIPSFAKGFNISFSGAETKAKDYLKKGIAKCEIARAVERCIAGSIEKIVRKAVNETGIKKVLIVGGVAANQYIREHLIKRLEHRAVGASLFFPHPKYSSDNAVGISIIANSMIEK